jgi:PhnB protein
MTLSVAGKLACFKETQVKKLDWFSNVENRTHPWEGMGLTWLTTALNVRDVSAAVDFYTGAMGMVAIAELEGGEGELLFARMRYRGTNFTLNKEGWDSGLVSPQTSGAVTPFIFYMYVDDVQTLAGDMTRAGAKMLSEPSEMFWGDLKARLEDPFGFIWDIAQKL